MGKYNFVLLTMVSDKIKIKLSNRMQYFIPCSFIVCLLKDHLRRYYKVICLNCLTNTKGVVMENELIILMENKLNCFGGK